MINCWLARTSQRPVGRTVWLKGPPCKYKYLSTEGHDPRRGIVTSRKTLVVSTHSAWGRVTKYWRWSVSPALSWCYSWQHDVYDEWCTFQLFRGVTADSMTCMIYEALSSSRGVTADGMTCMIYDALSSSSVVLQLTAWRVWWMMYFPALPWFYIWQHDVYDIWCTFQLFRGYTADSMTCMIYDVLSSSSMVLQLTAWRVWW